MRIEGSSVNHVLDLVGFVVASAGVSWAQVGRSQKAPTRHPLARSLTAQLQHQKNMPFSYHLLQFYHSHPAILHVSLPASTASVGPHSSHPAASTGTHPVSRLGIHTSHRKTAQQRIATTYLSLPIAPHLSQHPIISASFMTGSRCGTCALSPARLPPPRVRSSSSSTNPGLGLSPNTYLPTDYHCVAHPRTIVSRRTIHVD